MWCITATEGTHDDSAQVGCADDMTDEVFANARKQREDDDVVVEFEMRRHRFVPVRFQHAMTMIGDVDTRFGQMRIVERLEGIELLRALLGCTVATKQMAVEVDAHLGHHSMSLIVLCSRHLNRRDEVLLAVCAQLTDGQL